MSRHLVAAFVFPLLVSALLAADRPTPLATCVEHQISLSIQPSTHLAEISDQGKIVCGNGWSALYLKSNATIKSFSVNNARPKFTFIADGDTARIPADIHANFAGLEVRKGNGLLLFQANSTDTVPFRIDFTAEFNDSVANVQFSREKVGNEVSGTILDQGAYLSASAGYYLQGAETMARFSLTADVPATWDAIADGNPLSSETKGDRKIQRFENPFYSDGYVFMAAPYVIRSRAVDGITVATYFFAEDTSLSEKYLSATADYIRTYQELIGPYPFTQFAVVENFFPTGYGMPGWTLLGQTVLKLPFIITSSLGHEVLHNWWGNSVYVDYKRGNWCEAATVYGADYRYKLLASADAARDYRKDILKEYLSYVNDGNDFPLRKFTARSSAETRTIGYNKGMMVFHLIEQRIGTESFFNAWKQAYHDYRGKAISWEEWIDLFQKSSGQDLGYIIPEWIDRAGAPELGMQIVKVGPADASGRKTVSLKITQSAATPYHLAVPIRAVGPNVSDSTIVDLVSAEAAFDFSVPAGATTIALDPDYHLFRRLYPEEVEPIISAVLGVPAKSLVSFAADQPSNDAFASFGTAVLEDSAHILSCDHLDSIPRKNAPILLNPKTLPEYLVGRLAIVGDSVTLDGQTFPLAGYTFVMAGQNWNGFGKYLVILTGDAGSLPRLGQLVPHYGKYSFLVFSGVKNVAKGQWQVTETPLRKVLP